MTPLVALSQPDTVERAAGTGARAGSEAGTGVGSGVGSGAGRQLATIRAYYGDAWFAGRSVLSLARDSDISELVSLGAQVVCVPTGFDPDQEWTCGPVDLVLHLGVLAQLDASHASLRHACAHASNLVIETPVCDSHEELLVRIERNPSSNEDLSSPEARAPSPEIYPSPARIERLLVEHGMLFQRLADSRCNGPEQVYDWLATGSGRVTASHRRLWFARKG